MFFIMLSELRFVKWVRLFERNCFVNWVIFFANFCWIWDFLAENLKLIDNIQIWGFESFFFWSKFVFFGTVLGLFCQFNFFVCNFFLSSANYGNRIFFSAPYHKKATYGPVINSRSTVCFCFSFFDKVFLVLFSDQAPFYVLMELKKDQKFFN